jgi:alkylhydroperoxidase family enzyme
MARLPTIADEAAPAEVAKLFDSVRARGIAVPNLYRVLANSPAMLRTWLDFAWSLRLDAKTPRPLRELMIMRGAQLSEAEYEWAHHWPMASEAGVPEAKLRALATWPDSDLFDADERAVLRLADETAAHAAASEECLAELKARFAPDAVIELVLTASFYVCVGKFLKSLAIDVEPDYQAYRP